MTMRARSDKFVKNAFFPGIELVLGTRVKSVDARRLTLVTSTGETITYNFLIIATGARVWIAQ